MNSAIFREISMTRITRNGRVWTYDAMKESPGNARNTGALLCKESFLDPAFRRTSIVQDHPVTYLKETQTISTQNSPSPRLA